MKGLVLKDFYTMASTIKTYALIIVIYTLVFGINGQNPTTAVFVSTIIISMAPVTAIAYDEQSKWDKMARTMPLSAKDIVLSKYLFSLALSVAAAVFSAAIIRIFDKYSFEYYGVMSIMVMSILLAVVYHSLMIPTIYKFGTTKGRIYTMLIMMLPALFTVALSFFGFWTSAIVIMLTEYGELCAAIVLLLIVLLYIGSVALSVKIYKNKDL